MATSNVFLGSLFSTTSPSFGFVTPTAVPDLAGPNALTAASIVGGVLTCTPAAQDNTYTLPTATDLLAALPSTVMIGNTISFTVENHAATVDARAMIIAVPDGSITTGLTLAELSVQGSFNGGAAASNSGSATFKLRLTGIAVPAFVLYRVA